MAYETLSEKSKVELHTQRAADEIITDDDLATERNLIKKIDRRLLSITAILCSLTLLDSGIISSVSVTTIFKDLDLDVGERYSIVILVYTISSVAFQIPATILLRIIGPRVMFSLITTGFGVLTLCSAFIATWKQLLGFRIVLGMMQSSIFPGLGLLISTWYTKKEQNLRFAILQCGTVIFLGLGNFLNYGLLTLGGIGGLAAWRWIFLVNGLIAVVFGLVTYVWMVEFPEKAHNSFHFLDKPEQDLAVMRIQKDRGDVVLERFTWMECLSHFTDLKLYAFSLLLFLLSLVTTGIAYFIPIILKSGMGFSSKETILLSAPPYLYSVLPVLISSYVGDHFQCRGLVITINSACTIAGFIMLGFGPNVAIRYAGIFFATGAIISNWAAIPAFQTSNIAGQWKRVTYAAVTTIFSAIGGIAGTFIVKPSESPWYYTAVWVAVGSHIIIIFIVAIIITFMYHANKKQKKGLIKIEKTAGFRYIY